MTENKNKSVFDFSLKIRFYISIILIPCSWFLSMIPSVTETTNGQIKITTGAVSESFIQALCLGLLVLAVWLIKDVLGIRSFAGINEADLDGISKIPFRETTVESIVEDKTQIKSEKINSSVALNNVKNALDPVDLFIRPELIAQKCGLPLGTVKKCLDELKMDGEVESEIVKPFGSSTLTTVYYNLNSFESKSLSEVIKVLDLEKNIVTLRRAMRMKSSNVELDALIITDKELILIEIKKSVSAESIPRIALNFKIADAELRKNLKLGCRTSKWVVAATIPIDSNFGFKNQIHFVNLKDTKFPEQVLI